MSSSPSLTVVVADDQPLFRAGLRTAVDRHPNLTVAADAGDGHAALDLVRDVRPNLAAIALELPRLDGLAVLDAVHREELPTRIVIFSASFGGHDVRRALALGVAGLVSKRAEADEVLATLAGAARGKQVVDPRLAHLAGDGDRFERDEEIRPLTRREQEVLELMADGLSGPQIAKRLVVSPSTVKSHIENLYGKLGVSQRGAAVAEGMRRGLLS